MAVAIDRPSKLSAWRADAGLSLADVAALTGVSAAMISRAERGQRVLSPMAKVRVARGLGVGVAALFDPEVAA